MSKIVGPGFDVLGVIKTLSKTDNVELAYAGRGFTIGQTTL